MSRYLVIIPWHGGWYCQVQSAEQEIIRSGGMSAIAAGNVLRGWEPENPHPKTMIGRGYRTGGELN